MLICTSTLDYTVHFFLQVNFTCTLDNLKEFGQRCCNVRLLNLTEDADCKTQTAFNDRAGHSEGSHPCTWVAHLEMSHKLTNEQCKTLSSNIIALTSTNICWHGMWGIYYHNNYDCKTSSITLYVMLLIHASTWIHMKVSLLIGDHDIVTVHLQFTSYS